MKKTSKVNNHNRVCLKMNISRVKITYIHFYHIKIYCRIAFFLSKKNKKKKLEIQLTHFCLLAELPAPAWSKAPWSFGWSRLPARRPKGSAQPCPRSSSHSPKRSRRPFPVYSNIFSADEPSLKVKIDIKFGTDRTTCSITYVLVSLPCFLT